jgi:hypothetical protein
MKNTFRKLQLVLKDVLGQRDPWLLLAIIAIALLIPVNPDDLAFWPFLLQLSAACLSGQYLVVIIFNQWHIRTKEELNKNTP